MQAYILKYSADKEYFFHEGCFINELSNLPKDEALSIAQARVRPGEGTRRHCLRGTLERYLIIQGRGLVEIGAQPPQEVSCGDVVVIPADCPQRIDNRGEEDLVFVALCTPRFTPECYVDLA
jgi:mannose-6-phosphate isomerase-like protein (cupin superfamily)